MTHLMIRFRVSEFPKWISEYKAQWPQRYAAGLRPVNFFRNADDPKEIVLIYSVKDAERARLYTESRALKKLMANPVIVGKPDVSFLK